MLFVISAPSGAGKTTIINELFTLFPELKFSVSATTRKKRENEIDGDHYHFISVEDFNRKKDAGEFAEWEEVHGNLYGTLKSEVEPFIESEHHLIFDLDVNGALSLKEIYPEAITIFVDVPIEELNRRLKLRNTESDEEIELRLSRLMHEASLKAKFDYIIDNSKGIKEAVKQAADIIKKNSKKL